MCCQGAWDSSDVVVFRQLGVQNWRQSALFSTLRIRQQWAETTNAPFARQLSPALNMLPAICGPVSLALHPAPPTILTLHRHRRQAVQVPVLWRSICKKVCVLDFWIVSGVRISAPRDLVVGPTVGRRMARYVANSINRSSGFIY